MGDLTPSDAHQAGPMLRRLLDRRRLRRGVQVILETVAKAYTASQPRWPAGAPAGQGGQFAPKETMGYADIGEKVGAATGTNPGGFYEGPGGKFYVKEYKDHSRAAGEHLANATYRALGIGAPESFLVSVAGMTQNGVHASKIVEGTTVQQAGHMSNTQAQLFAEGFAADVLLANWDAVGTGKDNILIGKHDGNLYRIDNGGTLLMRAMEASGRKPEHLLDQITEVEGFLNAGKNPHYADVMQKAGYTVAALNNPNSPQYAAVQGQVEKITQLRDAHGGWKQFVDTVSPSWSGKDKARVVQMLEARTQQLAERFGLTATGKDIVAAVQASAHNSVDGIALPPPSSGSSYAAKGYNKSLAELGGVLNGSGSLASKIQAVEQLKGPTTAHFFGKKFVALKEEVLGQLKSSQASAKAKAVPIPTPPVIPLPANSGIHKAKWQQKAIDALHAAAKDADPYTAVAQIELGPSHSGTVKKYKQELLGWAAQQVPGTVGKDGKVTVAPAPKKAAPLGITPAATKLAEAAQQKAAKIKDEWETMFPAPAPPVTHSGDQYSTKGSPTHATLQRIQIERAARISPEALDTLVDGGHFDLSNGTPFSGWIKKMRVWSADRAKAKGFVTGKKGDNVSGFEIDEESVTGGKPEPVPVEMGLSSHSTLSPWGLKARQAIAATSKSQASAVSGYQGSDHFNINMYLLHTTKDFDLNSSPFKMAANLQKALNHPEARLPHDVKVVRKFGNSALASFFLGKADVLQGSTVNARTFMSSSLNGNFGKGRPISLVMHAKKGTRALYLNGGGTSGTSNYEQEILFPVGTRLRIHRVHKNEENHTVITASVVD